MLIVALATILAINVTFRGMVDQRRSANLFALDQGYQVALGAEAWAADILKRDAQDSQTDHLGETWAQSLPPLPIDEGVGTVEGRLEDMQGRFNLNNLVFADGTTNEKAVKQLERILAMLELEPGWATAIADWIDSDIQPGFPDGAEDTVYTGLEPAAPGRQHADHARERADGAARLRRRAFPAAGALRRRPARRHASSTSAPRRASCSTRCRRTQRQFSLNPQDLHDAAQGGLLPDAARTCAARWARPSTT